jgi:hypothetical protein
MRVSILEVDQPTKLTGRLYKKEVVEAALVQVKGDLVGKLDHPDDNDSRVKLHRASHMSSEFEIEGNELVCNIHVLDTPQGEVLSDMIEKGEVEFRAVGFGRVSEDGVVDEFEITSVSAVPKGVC